VVTVGGEAMRVGGKVSEKKVRRVDDGKIGAGGVTVLESRPTEEARILMLDGEGKLPALTTAGKQGTKTSKSQQPKTQFIPVYKSSLEDRKWAESSMVASIVSGDSVLAIQHRIDDASFHQMVVTPMGGNRVFLYCNNGENVWTVFNDVVHFFWECILVIFRSGHRQK